MPVPIHYVSQAIGSYLTALYGARNAGGGLENPWRLLGTRPSEAGAVADQMVSNGSYFTSYACAGTYRLLAAGGAQYGPVEERRKLYAGLLGPLRRTTRKARFVRAARGGTAAGARRDGFLNEFFINIQRILANIHEHGHAAAQHDGVGCGYEGIGRHDHFIAGLNIQQQSLHFQSCGAGMSKQGLAASAQFFQPLMAALGIRAVAGQSAVEVGLGNIVEFLAGHVRPVERNMFRHITASD